MKHSQLSMLQIFFLLTALIISTGHFLYVRVVLIYLGRDGWMVIVPSILTGMLVFYPVIKLARRFPDQTLIEATFSTYGKWLGRLLTLPYLLFFMAVPALIIRAIGDFLPTTMPYTPYSVITSVIVLLACITVKLGIEVIGRCALLMLPLLIVIGILASILTLKDKHYEYVMPFFQTSLLGFLRGTITLSGLFSESIVAGMILLHVRQQELKIKKVVLFFLIIGLMFVGPLTGPVAVFDIESARKFTYPTYEEIRYIEIANFLERLDVLGVLLWASGSFLKISAFLYALSLGLAQWFGLKDYRPLVFPLAVMLLLQATHFASNRAEIWVYLMKIFPLFALGTGLLFPWLTLLVATLRKRKQPQPEKEASTAA
ncbi:MAG: GerAB/ArcD/ProY family transporter [Tumebacillaceae bacterium]